MMKRWFPINVFLLVCVCGFTGCVTGGVADTPNSLPLMGKEGLAIVKDGKSSAPIIVAKGAPPKIQEAVEELSDYINKISGAKPKIIEGAPKKLPEHAIWIGYQPVLKNIFPKLDFDFKYPEEVLIAANPNHIVIIGRDRWVPDHLVVADPNSFIYKTKKQKITGKQQEYGTANAVYTFIQDCLGVRWLWPGELGTDVIKQKTIAFQPFKYRYHPQVRARSGLLHYSWMGGRGMSKDWTRHQRLQLDSLYLPGGHAFVDWWDRFRESDPDIFALQPDGKRDGFPAPQYVKLCQSNPKVVELWLKDVERQLKDDPTRTVFNATPNDGYTSGICVCDECRKWDHPDGEIVNYHWRGKGQEYVAMSDRYITFANKLAKRLKERFPDKDYYVLMMAYGNSRPAPVAAIPAENVIVPHVSHFPWNESRRVEHKEQWRKWKAKGSPKMMYRPNTGSYAGWQQGLPEVVSQKIIEDFKFLADQNCVGVFVDANWEHWSTHGPQYYLMARLIWDSSVDGDAVLDDYYRRGYGPAASDIKAYWDLFEGAREEYISKNNAFDTKKDKYKLSNLYTPELLSKAEKILDRADAKVIDNPKYRDRVAFTRAGLEYTKLMAENIALMKKYAEGECKDEKMADQVRTNWKKIQELWKDRPNAFSYMWLRPITPRMVGLHPDHMTTVKKSKQNKKKPVKLNTGLDLD